MRKIKPKREDHSKDSGPDLYEIYFKKHNIDPNDCMYDIINSVIDNINNNTMRKILVKGTIYNDDLGRLISNEDRLDTLIEDRIIENNRKKY